MTTSTDPALAAPSLEVLARTTAIAVAVAAVILVALVLPAEYAVDPRGTGRWLGLTEIAAPTVTPVEVPASSGARLVPVQQGPWGAYPAPFMADTFELTLQPYEYVEYKYGLEQGATLVYAWTASAPLIQDFHGERAVASGDGSPAEESFDKANRQNANGTLTAPFAGIHGWYWENPGGSPVTIRLTTAGYYGSAVEIRSDRTRHARALQSPDTWTSLPAPAAASDAAR